MDRRVTPLLGAALMIGLFAPTSASGMTIVPPANLGDLARQSRAVVLATAIENRVSGAGIALATRTTFAVDRAVAGTILAGQLVGVEVPGGEQDGLGLFVAGAPRFVVGGTYLLFLAARPDGTWTPQMMSYGILVEQRAPGGASILAPLGEAAQAEVLPRPDDAGVEPPGTYVEGPLLDMLADVAAGRARWDASRARVPLPTLTTQDPQYCVYEGYRWQDFDSGGHISMAADSAGDDSLGGGGASEVQGALNGWTGLSGTSLDTRYGGEVSVSFSPGCTNAVTNDTVVFNDPCNQLPDLSNCNGVLAGGGAAYYTSSYTFNGDSWHPAFTWFVVVNNGAGCVGASNYQTMMEHELGHGLGFGHITGTSSLMNPACEGGSCTGIQPIDITCADFIYPAQATSPPDAPTNVQASDGTYADRVRVSWNSASGATSYEVFRNTTNDSGGAGSVGSTPNASLDDTGATPGTTYYYWVKASNNLGTSGFGGPDTGYAVVCNDPAAPTASAPPSVLSGDYYGVTWDDTSPDHTYDLQEATNASFIGASTYSVTGTSRTIKHTVSQNTTYYYRVDAKTFCGNAYQYSPYSGTVSVQVQVSCGDPGVPSLSAPASSTSGTNYQVSWSGTSPDNTYVLQESTDPGFASSTSFNVTGTAKLFNHTVTSATTYYYRVQATYVCNSTTYTSNPSNIGQTQVNPACDPPPTPTLAAPAAANSGVAYVVSWSATSPTSTYEVQEATSASFAGAATFAVTGTSQSFSHVVTSATTYFYRVRATNQCSGSTAYSGYSASASTAVNPQCDPPGAVALLSPANGSGLAAGATTVALSWQAATGAGSYDLYFGTASSPPLAASGLAATSTTRPVAPGSTYHWKVVAHAACNSTLTATSAVWSFVATPATPAPVASFTVAPEPHVTGVGVQFTDTSSGSPTAWSWSFGDGGTSSQKNPSHVYAGVGSFTVTLTASNAGGASQATTTLSVVAPAPTGLVAVVAHNVGLGQSAWRSDMGISNPGAAPATYALIYKPSGGGTATTVNLAVQPHATAWLDDVMASQFSLGNGRGSLRLVPPAAGPAPAVFSRTYAASPSGNLGQGIPSLAPLAAGTYVLPGLFQDNAYRTNLGVTAGPASVQVTIDLFRGTSATPVASPKVFTVGAWDQQQWSLGDLFPGAAQPGVPMTARVALSGAAVPWASIVDQVSQDSVFRLGTPSATDWFVVVAAHNPGANQTYWRTDVALWNPSSTTIAVTAEYLPEGHDNAGGGATALVATLPPYASMVVADVAGTAFGIANGKGALRLTAGGRTFVAATRTYTTRAAGGTLGQGVMAVPTGQVGGASRSLTGVRMNGANRTNIGLAAPGAGVSVDLTLRDGDGAVLATRSGFWVPARSLVQMTFADAFPGAASPSPAGTIDVVPHGPLAVYLSVVDGTSNDPVLVLAY